MKDIEESKVGSGTAVADKSAEKRAQLSLKMVQLRMKQNKEREALAAQRKSLQKEETMTESFNTSQIAALKAEYSKINTIDPSSDTYKKLIAMLDKLDLKSLQSLAGAEIKFVSKLAQNRVARKNMKKEEVQIEELSPKQKALDKNKNGKIDGSDLAAIRNKKKPQGADFAAQRRKERLASNGRMDEGKSDYEIYHKDYSSAVQTAIKQAEKRGYEVDMDDWHDKVATGPKKPSAGKTNSFSVKLKKDGKESKKALHLQVYNMDNHKYELNMYIESVEEAASPAQQAAIAIAMKKAGKKPKMSESIVATIKDKLNKIKRGNEAQQKADDHFDKAGNPKNANASKDLKKAVRYHNLLNKEEVVLEAKKKTFKDVKKKMKEETPNNASVKKGEPLTGKKEPIEINPELKEEVK
jgi:hypothetical protein